MNKPITIREYRDLLLSKGFKVTDRDEMTSWFLFEKNGILGYCQKDSYYGIGFSSVNKPHHEYGVGTVIFRHLVNPTVDDAEEMVRRQWSHFKSESYKSLEEYINYPTNKWAKYRIIYPK